MNKSSSLLVLVLPLLLLAGCDDLRIRNAGATSPSSRTVRIEYPERIRDIPPPPPCSDGEGSCPTIDDLAIPTD